MRELVRGYAAASFESAEASGRLEQVHGDLIGFARALTASNELRLVLVDALILTQTRRSIVIDLLEGRAAPEAAALCSFTTAVERPPELPAVIAALVELAEDEIRRRESGTEFETELEAGRNAVRERIRGYAERVLQELAALDDVDRAENELFSIARVVDANRALRETIGNSDLTYAGRAAIIDDLFASACQVATVRLVKYVLRSGRLRDVVGTLEWLVELAAEERGRRIAEVRSAVPLGDDERRRIAAALGRLVEREVEVRDVIDSRVIGGVLVSVGDLVIDGTVRLRLERLRDLLAKAS